MSLLADDTLPWQLAASLVGAALASAGGALSRRLPRLARPLASLGLVGLLAAVAPALVHRPLVAFFLLLASVTFIATLWSPSTLRDLVGRRLGRPGERGIEQQRVELVDVRLSAAIALASWLGATVAAPRMDVSTALACAATSLLAIGRGRAFTRHWMPVPWQRVADVVLALALPVAAGLAIAGHLAAGLSILAGMPAAALVLARARGPLHEAGWLSLILDHPARLVAATFLSLCVLGAVLLSMPMCAADGAVVTSIDAAFTAVSAVCVTGLITLDTPNAWSGAGLVVILLLIQVGGLGIMTLSTVALGALGRRLSVRHEEAVAGLFSREHRGQLFIALRRTLAVTCVTELAGAAMLALLFWGHGDELPTALWRGLFTSISAFCNAGFALQSDSLVGYQDAPAVLHTVAILIVAGGLAPAVVIAAPRLARRQPVPVQAKIVLAATGALLVAGFVGFAVLEWRNTLAGLSPLDRLHNAWFQSVTLRTAGFNSIDFADLLIVSLPLACVFMFIGGAPGGTAGGIKVTTMWVLGSAVAGALRGHPEATSFRRRIPQLVVYRAIAITVIAGFILTIVLLLLLLTQRLPATHALFEAFSAMGTVGLSMGGTEKLDGLGKIVIMIAMFLGRVGPLTAFVLLVERQIAQPTRQLEENLEVG